jgi:PAS domain S-box-containing protein
VLVIDDDIDDRFLIAETVEGADGAVVCAVAPSYQSGEAAILEGDYDACLVDYRLGARSGIDLIRELRDRAAGPLILLTGAGGWETDDQALAAGAADYIEKSSLTTEGIRRSIRYAIRMWNESSRYQSLFDGVPVGLFRSDPEAFLVEVNETAVEMLGHTDKRSLTGVHVHDLFVDASRISEASSPAPTGPVTVTDLEVAKSDGTTLWVDIRIRPVYSTGGAVGWMEWAMTEVTQRREAERRADFRAELLDQVNSAVIVTDNEGICTLWNRQAEIMYGWTAAEAVGHPIMELTVRAEDEGVATEIMEHVAANRRWEGEFTVRRKDGSTFLSQVSNASLTDEQGASVGVVGVSLDVTASRRAEAESRRNEQLIAAAFQSSPIGKVIATPDLSIVSCNPAYASFLGVQPNDVIGKNVRDFMHADDLAVANDTAIGLTTGAIDKNVYDRRFIRPDGQIVWGRVHVSRIHDDHGQVTHLLGQVLDITGAKRSEDRIRFQASLLDQVHHAVMATDMNGAVTYWNQRAETLFGWRKSEVIGRSLTDVVLPEKAPDFLATVYAALSEHGMWEGEVTLVRKDGSTFPAWASDTLICDAAGNPAGFVGVKLDMTDIKQAEQRARSQEALNRTLLETVSVPIAIVDADGRLIVSNPSWERITRASEDPGGYLPACINEHTAPGLGTKLTDGITGVIEGVTRQFVVEYPCEEAGDHRFFRTVVVGAESGAVISHWDITDERMARGMLEDTIRAKDAFIASISHELRTPLTAVLGLSEVLRSGTVPIEDVGEFITLIADQAQEVSLIVEDLLVAGRLESNTLTIQPIGIDLAEETKKVIQPWIHTGSIDIDIALTAGSAFAFADPLRVRQILRNLITNAHRYGRPPVAITGFTVDDRCVVRVTDRGEGIPPHAEVRLFEPYARFGPVDGQPLSVGLGLHVARGLARLMGGDLTYRRQDGETILELTLPSGAVTDPVVS